MNFQIRIRDGDYHRVMGVLDSYIDEAEKVLVFAHNPPKEVFGTIVYNNQHHHIYFFNLNKTDAGIRKYLGSYYSKESFAVKKTAGGKKALELTPAGAYQYATTEKLIDPEYTKGFEDHQLEEFRLRAEFYYRKPGEPTPKQHGDTIVVVREETVVKQDKVWIRLLDNKEKYRSKTVAQIKSSIAADWLNQGKALPRQCDLHRYALSLYYILKYEGEVPEDALETVYSIE